MGWSFSFRGVWENRRYTNPNNNGTFFEKKPGKGRPYKIYTLKVDFNDIITQLEEQHKKAIDETQEKIERLKELEK
jgi:predicted transcriptional regulator